MTACCNLAMPIPRQKAAEAAAETTSAAISVQHLQMSFGTHQVCLLYTSEAETAPSWNLPEEKTPDAFYRSGGAYRDEQGEALNRSAPILRPRCV